MTVICFIDYTPGLLELVLFCFLCIRTEIQSERTAVVLRAVFLVGDSDCVPFPRVEGLTRVIKGRLFLLRAVWCLSVGGIVVLS